MGKNLTFGQAIEYLKHGRKVKRKDWGGYWFIPNEMSFGILMDKETSLYASQSIDTMILARLKDGGYAPAQPYQADILSEDWELVE